MGKGCEETEPMKATTTMLYDTAGYLNTPEEIVAYLEASFEEASGDTAFIAKALGNVARSKGMAKVAREAGLSRQSLYKTLSGERSPGFDTVLKVMGALGLNLHVQVSQPRKSRSATRSSKRRVA